MTKHVSFITISGAIVVMLLTNCFSLYLDINRFAVAQTVDNNSFNTLIPLNGPWEAGDKHKVVISQSGTNLTVDMSSYDRPTAYGSILNDSAIAVIFPDDQSYNGKIVPPDKIEWSDNTTWKKKIN